MKYFSFIILLSSLSACASRDSGALLVHYTPPQNTEIDVAEVASATAIECSSLPTVTLDEVLRAARENSPALSSARSRITAQQYRHQAAGQYPNPQVTLGNEKIGLSQPIIIGGDLSDQRDVAAAQLAVAEADFSQVQLQVDAQLRGAFASLLMLQMAVDYQQQLVVLSQQTLATIGAQVAAGELTASATNELLITIADQEFQIMALQRKLKLAQRKLATLTAAPSDDLIAEGNLQETVAVPQLALLLADMERLPVIAKSLSQAQVAKMQQQLAYAQAIPDFDLELFYTHDGQVEAALLFELPLSNRNNDLYRGAQQLAQSAQSDTELQIQDTRIALLKMHVALEQSIADYSRFNETVVPLQQRSYNMALAQHHAGDISLATLNSAHTQLLDAQISSLQAWLQMILDWQTVRQIIVFD